MYKILHFYLKSTKLFMKKNYVFKSVLAMLMVLRYLMHAMARVSESHWKLLQEVEGVKA